MQIFLGNNYDNIRCYFMAYPCHFDVMDNSNPHKGTIDKSKVFEQYNNFVNFIIDQGIKVQFLDIVNSTEQVFTRDIGFVVEEIFFVSKMKASERAREIKPLLKIIQKHGLKHHIMQNSIEGGDVIHYGGVLFIGIGDRTNNQAVTEVQNVLNENKIELKTVPIRFDANKIHLDCAFNTLDQDSCVITDYVYDTEAIQKHVKNCIKMERTVADELGANYIYLGDRKVVTHSEGTRKLLNAHGYQVYYTDYSELVKARGSLGCCTLSTLRGLPQ